MLRATFDTNVLNYAEEEGHPSPVELDEVLELLRREDVDVAVAGVWWRDNAVDPDDERREELREALSRYPSLGPGPFRLDVSPLDGPDGVASEADAEVAVRIESVLWRGGGARGRRMRGRVTDVDHVLAHYLAGRDVFVTTDRDFLSKREELSCEFGIRVARPSEVLRDLGSE